MADDGYKVRGSSELNYGDGSTLDAASGVADSAPDLPGEMFAGTPSIYADAPPDGLEAELFAPTDRPDRPLTYGASFGPGPNYPRLPHLSPDQMKVKTAHSIIEMKDDMPDEVLVWALSVLQGK